MLFQQVILNTVYLISGQFGKIMIHDESYGLFHTPNKNDLVYFYVGNTSENSRHAKYMFFKNLKQ